MSNATATNHKEVTAHIRARIKAAGIKASVRKYTSCGHKFIAVDGATYDQLFSEDEQRRIRTIAKVNGLTRSRGMEIDIEQMTDSRAFTFLLNA